MNILSYRGPSSAGGVSGALSRLNDPSRVQKWWYLDGNVLSNRWSAQAQPEQVYRMPSRIVEGHYRYCNNFLWPVLHDLPEFATFNAHDKLQYKQFNLIFANNIINSNESQKRLTCHINDYQLALTAKFIELSSGRRDSSIFWHIPWPETVSPKFSSSLIEIAEGLLTSKQIGFHIAEYVTNFLEFVQRYMPAYIVDFENQRVIHGYGLRKVTNIVALPLGLDFDFWVKQGNLEGVQVHIPELKETISGKFVLSVDRADYTKGILQRMDGIDQFFAEHENWIGDISFLQICQRSRPGLPAFDEYWQRCRTRAEEINSRWQRGNWQPIVWVQDPLSPDILSQLYRRATAMLVSPLRDGLNLTAKEFAACSESGVLLLAPGAGVWHEVGEYAVLIEPLSATKMSTQIMSALSMPETEKRMRLTHLKRLLKKNTIGSWWQQFTRSLGHENNVLYMSGQKSTLLEPHNASTLMTL